MMINKTKAAFVLIFLIVLFTGGVSYGEEMPEPGMVIDKSNYMKYSHLFPTEFLPAFKDGFDGVITPIHAKVIASTPSIISKRFSEFSKKNKGKYHLDAEGDIVDFDRQGWPFPDLDRNDPQFIQKLMWNYDNNYLYDTAVSTETLSYEKRRNEKLRSTVATLDKTFYTSRMFIDPKPALPNPLGLYYSYIMGWLKPQSMKNSMMLYYKYVDAKKQDEIYMYLPSMRRILRADAGQKSTPMMGSITAPDDFNGFQGQIPLFNFKLIKEQKLLVVSNSTMTDQKAADIAKTGDFPFPYDNWEVKDVYVIEITSKDPKYPQSKKVIYMDKVCLINYFSISYDRAGSVWKLAMLDQKVYKFPQDQHHQHNGQFMIDVQFGLANYISMAPTANGKEYVYEDFTPSAVLMKAR